VIVKRRLLLIAAGAACLAALWPAAAPATVRELGKLASDPTPPPSCPSTPCLAVSRTTGYQAKVGDRRGVVAAPSYGKVVAWTISLAKPGKKQISFFNDNLGGAASAGISVLKPGRNLRYRVTGQSPIVSLEPYFGMTVQFPLDRALTVKKGYVVALTVPTWAPALAVGLDAKNSWRASRPKGTCNDTQTQTAQLTRGQVAQYACLYRGVRLTYSALMVTMPSPRPRPPTEAPSDTTPPGR
jgi:hypothetical protein